MSNRQVRGARLDGDVSRLGETAATARLGNQVGMRGVLASRELFYVEADEDNAVDDMEGLVCPEHPLSEPAEIRLGGHLLVVRGTSHGDLRTMTYLGAPEGAGGGDGRGLPGEFEISRRWQTINCA